MNPFEMSGQAFLKLYAVLFVIAIVAAVYLRKKLRHPGGEPPPEAAKLDPYQISYLAGGEKLALNAALAGLAQQSVIVFEAAGRRFVVKEKLDEGQAHPVETAVYNAIAARESPTVSDLHKRVPSVIRQMHAGLERMGLLLSTSDAWVARLVPGVVFLALGALAAGKLMIGAARHKPVGFLIAALVVTGIAAFITFGIETFRSRRGDATLRYLRNRGAALQTAAARNQSALSGADMVLAVGLFGLTVLQVGLLADLYTAIHPPTGGSCGSGCSSGSGCSGGGGGCGGGGGGCGGCGGGS